MFLKTLIDDYITPLLASSIPDYSGLLTALLVMAAIFAVGIIAALCYNRWMVTIAQGVLRKVRDEMFSKMQSLPIKYFDTNTHGDIMSHYTNDTDTLRMLISQSLPQIISGLFTITAVLIAMLVTSIQLTIVVLISMWIISFVTLKIGGKSAVHFKKQQKCLGTTNGYIEEMINGQKVIKSFCHEEEAKKAFDNHNKELCKNTTAAYTFANTLMPIVANLGYMQYAVLAIVGGAIAIGGGAGLTLGAIVAFLTLSRSLTIPLGLVSQQAGSIVMAAAGAGRIFELLDENPEDDTGCISLVNAKMDGETIVELSEYTGIRAWKQPNRDGSVTYTKLTGDVRFNHVTFAYEEGKPVLTDVSLFAKPGQKIAFVGATGAGKTTITNLINRFYDISVGQITFDGIDIKRIKKKALRSSLSVVLQETNLFTGTVMDNIRYGRLDATDEEVFAAAKLANAHDFIERLPEGYNTLLTANGDRLSQGQKQLISIARAAVANPPVMILDEATSSIDTRTEAIVQKGMDSLMYGRTVFVIAHRLSTVQNSAAIIVLDHGQIIERGNHKELLELKGKYYQLYTGAFELE